VLPGFKTWFLVELYRKYGDLHTSHTPPVTPFAQSFWVSQSDRVYHTTVTVVCFGTMCNSAEGRNIPGGSSGSLSSDTHPSSMDLPTSVQALVTITTT
jgi:hypothetical protein